MAEFIEQDLSGTRFERVDLSGAAITGVRLRDARPYGSARPAPGAAGDGAWRPPI